MREIKFRAWISSIQKFVYFENGEYSDRNSEGIPIFNWELAEQYTGLKDKNGKEIYEGDIWARNGYIAIVEFDFSQWSISKAAKSSKCISYPYFHSCAGDGEIIGNIRENPEL